MLHKEKITNYATGTTIQHLTKSNFSNYKISLPPVDYQKKVVNLLDKLETSKQEGLEYINKLRILKKRLIKYYITGENSKEKFKEYKLGEIVDFVSGTRISQKIICW